MNTQKSQLPIDKGSQTDILILSLARGVSHRAAAREAGCGTSTVTRRLKCPLFRKQVAECRSAILNRSVGILVACSIVAAKTLKELCDSKKDLVKLAAAKTILELAGLTQRAIDAAETEARVAALEQLFKNRSA